MTIEEIFESISDTDLEYAIKEMHELENSIEGRVSETIMLNEIYCKLNEIEALEDGMEYVQLSMLCTKEYSYRKAGLK